jgi:hypothetical protein
LEWFCATPKATGSFWIIWHDIKDKNYWQS